MLPARPQVCGSPRRASGALRWRVAANQGKPASATAERNPLARAPRRATILPHRPRPFARVEGVIHAVRHRCTLYFALERTCSIGGGGEGREGESGEERVRQDR